jgi:exosortase/archaeosortase family protein
MSKKKKQEKKNAIPSSENLSLKLKSFWKEKGPVIIFLGGFGILMGIFYAFWFSEIFKVNILAPVVKANALIASKVLNIFGFGTQSNGTDLYSPAFTISVKQGCDAIEPIAIFTFAVLLFPVSFRTKAFGLLVGIPLLWLLNQVRIISLFVFGIYSSTLFDIMHVQVWQAVFIGVTLVTLAYWIVWALRSDRMKTATIA